MWCETPMDTQSGWWTPDAPEAAMATQFEQLGPADAPRLAAAIQRWPLLAGMRRATLVAEAERVLADPGQWQAWLIRRGDQVIGYLVLQFRAGALFEAPRARVAGLYVDPGERSGELARAALRFASDVARWLHVRFDAADAGGLDRHVPTFLGATRPAPRWILASTQVTA